MFDNIFKAMKKSIEYNSLDTRRLYFNARRFDFMKCIIGDRVDKEIIKDASYIDSTVAPKTLLTYVMLDTDTLWDLRHDTAFGFAEDSDIMNIIVYRYNDTFETSSVIILSHLLEEARYIITSLNRYKDSSIEDKSIIEQFDEFNKMDSIDKLILLAPYAMVCKLYDELDFIEIATEEFDLQKALNPHNIERIDNLLRFILEEKPSMDILFKLNAILASK